MGAASEPGMELDPRMVAGVDLLRRTGLSQFQLRWSDDEQPTIWIAVAIYSPERFDTAAGPTPLRAVMRLCEQLVDGGECTHCRKPTGFTDDFTPMPPGICWYQWDPERRTFRRSCEGDQ